MELDNARFEELDGGVDAAMELRRRDMGVAEIEGEGDGREVADVEDLEQVFGGGDFVLKIFEQDFYAQGMSEGLEVLDGGEGIFDGTGAPGIVLEAEVEGDGGEGNLLRGFRGRA